MTAQAWEDEASAAEAEVRAWSPSRRAAELARAEAAAAARTSWWEQPIDDDTTGSAAFVGANEELPVQLGDGTTAGAALFSIVRAWSHQEQLRVAASTEAADALGIENADARTTSIRPFVAGAQRILSEDASTFGVGAYSGDSSATAAALATMRNSEGAGAAPRFLSLSESGDVIETTGGSELQSSDGSNNNNSTAHADETAHPSLTDVVTDAVEALSLAAEKMSLINSEVIDGSCAASHDDANVNLFTGIAVQLVEEAASDGIMEHESDFSSPNGADDDDDDDGDDDDDDDDDGENSDGKGSNFVDPPADETARPQSSGRAHHHHFRTDGGDELDWATPGELARLAKAADHSRALKEAMRGGAVTTAAVDIIDDVQRRFAARLTFDDASCNNINRTSSDVVDHPFSPASASPGHVTAEHVLVIDSDTGESRIVLRPVTAQQPSARRCTPATSVRTACTPYGTFEARTPGSVLAAAPASTLDEHTRAAAQYNAQTAPTPLIGCADDLDF